MIRLVRWLTKGNPTIVRVCCKSRLKRNQICLSFWNFVAYEVVDSCDHFYETFLVLCCFSQPFFCVLTRFVLLLKISVIVTITGDGGVISSTLCHFRAKKFVIKLNNPSRIVFESCEYVSILNTVKNGCDLLGRLFDPTVKFKVF